MTEEGSQGLCSVATKNAGVSSKKERTFYQVHIMASTALQNVVVDRN